MPIGDMVVGFFSIQHLVYDDCRFPTLDLGFDEARGVSKLRRELKLKPRVQGRLMSPDCQQACDYMDNSARLCLERAH